MGEGQEGRQDIEDLGSIASWGRVEITNKCFGAMTCRVLAPELFREVKAKSKSAFHGQFTEVGKRIESPEEHRAVRQAVFSCPAKAIRWTEIARRRDGEPLTGLPQLYGGYPVVVEDDVYYMGHSDKTTFGCAGFFLRCGAGRNVLIDPPIANPDLVRAVNDLGGVQHLLFTHKDHTGNHEAWFKATQAPRLIHEADVVAVKNDHSPFPVTSNFERILTLSSLESCTLEGVPELQIMLLPGHTPGSLCFLYKGKFLFTGDSLAYSPAKGHLHGHRVQCWQDWRMLTQSMKELLRYDFQWVLPGHGDWHRFDSAEAAKADLRKGLAWMGQQASGRTWLPWYIIWTMVRPKQGGLIQLFVDSALMPHGAKAQFPNWTMPAWMVWLALSSPLLALGLNSRARLLGRLLSQ